MNKNPNSPAYDTLVGKIEDRTAVVGILGLGYVGLPLIQAFIRAGYQTVGFDVDQRKVDRLLAGESYIGHIDSAWIAQHVADGQFEPTCDPARLSRADALLICVPTPLNESRDPDLSYVRNTAETIAGQLREGQLVVLESTTYPGTTREIVLPALQAAGLQVGREFFLAYSPEREDPGNPDFSAQGIPKVVGGIDEPSVHAANQLYSQAVVQTVPVASCEIAEACKILENTYRSVNIAMVNELKILFQKLDIDIWQVIEAAKTKPFGFQAFYPGPGLGGHCIPIDPFYLSWLARRNELSTRFIELAGEINRSMPEYVVSRVALALNRDSKPIRGSRIGILGVAYKKDVDDPRESPSFRIMELLSEAGAELTYNDPFIPQLPQMRHYDVESLQSEALTPDYLRSQDLVLIATDHSQYDWEFIVEHATLIVDTRNATAGVTGVGQKVVRA